MKLSEKNDNIIKKLFELKKKLQPVKKSAENPYFNSTYADLNSHIDAVEPLAQELGLLVTQPLMRDEVTGAPYIETTFTDVETNQYAKSKASLILSKQDPQALGSAITYTRRYALNAFLGMKAVDDDGQVAVHGTTKPTTTAPTASANPSTTKPKSSFRKTKIPTSETELANEVKNVDPNSNNVDGWEN